MVTGKQVLVVIIHNPWNRKFLHKIINDIICNNFEEYFDNKYYCVADIYNQSEASVKVRSSIYSHNQKIKLTIHVITLKIVLEPSCTPHLHKYCTQPKLPLYTKSNRIFLEEKHKDCEYCPIKRSNLKPGMLVSEFKRCSPQINSKETQSAHNKPSVIFISLNEMTNNANSVHRRHDTRAPTRI